MTPETGTTSTPASSRHDTAIPTETATEPLFPQATPEIAEERTRLAPEQARAFREFSRSVFAPGALSTKTKQLIAVAVAHVTQCPYCIRSHTRAARRQEASREEIMEAIWVAAEMRAGGAYAHSALALDTFAHERTTT
jgi:AhpD family alkylhydroperoxidase